MVIRSCIFSCWSLTRAPPWPASAMSALGVDRPALDEAPAHEDPTDRCGSREPSPVRQLERMSRHRLMDDQVDDHRRVVLTVERVDPLGGQPPGVGATARNVCPPTSSGPGASQ